MRDLALSVVAILALVAGLVTVPAFAGLLPAAVAAGTPDVQLTRTVPAHTLYGKDVTVTLTATAPDATPDVDGFNLTFTDVLPAGATVTASDLPVTQRIAQLDGTTLLIWENVADLLDGAEVRLAYSYSYPRMGQAGARDVGDVLGGTAHAYVNTDPFMVPNPAATPADGSVWEDVSGSGTATSSTELVPYTVRVRELLSPEGELLRGVHDDKTVYQVQITNNTVAPTSNVVATTWLPAGLEFLGCTADDNSTGAAEYPGAPALDASFPSVTSCDTAFTATTVREDPDGSGGLPEAVYTQVVWSGLGTMAANAVITLRYAAAIPLHANSDAVAVTDPVANLDNNTGAEADDEAPLTTYAAVAGDYQGGLPAVRSFVVDDDVTVTAEDVRIVKSASTGTINQAQNTTWTLDIATSEYVTGTGPIVVTDTIPDGLDFAGSPITPTSVSAPHAGGTITVVWTLGALEAQDTAQITYQTTTRADYRASGHPVSANDSWTNVVDLATSTTVRTGADGAATRAVATVIDHSEAGQVAEDVQRNKLIAAPVGGSCTAVTTWLETSAAPFHPGDTVCFRLDVDFPDQLDTVKAKISDYLPAGFTLVGTPAYNTPLHDLGDSVALNYQRNAAGTVLTWEKDEVDTGDYFSAILTTTISSIAATQKTDVVGNLLKVRYQNTPAQTFQLRDQADAEITAPLLTLTKALVSPVGGVVQARQSVQYSITVANTGTQTATNVEVRDVLPAGWTCAEVTTPAAGCAAGTISWTGLTIPAGGSIVLDVVTTAPVTAAPGDSYTNRAGVRSYEGASNAGVTVYYPASNIDATVTPNTDRADGTAVVTVAGATIEKTASSLSENGNSAGGQATIGEVVTFTVRSTIPAGSTLYGSPSVSDPVNARYAIVGTPTYTVDTDGAGGAAPSAPIDATVTGATISIPLGPVDGGDATTYVNPSGSGADIVVLTYQARVLDAATNRRSVNTAIPNTATLAWRSSAGTARTATASANISVVEPNLTLAKSANRSTATPGDTITYTITISNPTAPGRVSVAHGIDVVDTVPAQLLPLTTGGVPAADGDPVLGTGGGVWDADTSTITFTPLTSLNPGATATVSYQARVQNPVLTPGSVVNQVRATTSSMAGSATGERVAGSANGGTGSGYVATASQSLNAPAITLVKSAGPGTRTIGQLVDYTVAVTIPAGTYANDVWVRDTLAPGVRFHAPGGLTATCDQGGSACSPDVSASLIGSPTASDTVVGFWLGDLGAATATRVVTLRYVGIVTTTAALGGQQNTAALFSHATDLQAGTPATVPTSGYTAGSTSNASVTVQRPVLSVVKRVDGVAAQRAKPGQTLTYTVTVTNAATGNTSAAHDITVTDTPDPRLTGYTAAAIPGVTPVDTDPSDGTLRWTVPGPLAPGASITITYQLTVSSTLDETAELAGAEVRNTADVPSYFGVPAAQRTLAASAYAEYDDVTASSADVELDLASVGDRVWFDVDGDGVQDAGEPGFANVRVDVLYAGADATFGTADDETVTRTTDANGDYLATRLPGGQYRVSVRTADLPAGITPTFDLDGIATASRWEGALAENAALRTVDFGYTGTGSLGDRVWFDQDADGVQDAGEPGIAGRTVTVVSRGVDGVFGTADDITTTATTNASGVWTVGRLLGGTYRVTVSGMPAGYGPTYDLDGTGTASTATATLTAGQTRTDLDFGYAGTGSIGDLVWIDRDEDGVFEPAGATPEQGVAGATVQLLWYGVAGTTADPVVATFTTTTDATGGYSFAHLVPGVYVVRVTGGLPAAATNTHDRDGNRNSQTPVTLADGEAVTDADFGYDSDSSLGQRVWWDRDADGVQDAGEPGFAGVDLTVRWFGPNGTEGDGDDRLFSATTAADGSWSLPDLPQGEYRVSVDTADLPAGLTQTFDADGVGTASTSRATLGTGAVLTQNFGYRGAFTLGDLVFLDRDADGAQDGGEPGLAGVTVLLEWNGLSIAEVTDASGAYTFTGVPAGAVEVRIATASLPSTSLAPVSDVQGSATDGTAALTVSASRSDVDFGVRGTASIGDTVWFDRDADGVLDAGEAGIPGVTVTASWAGRDGAAGTADDIVLSTVTDAAGGYAFDHLPAGDWIVAVTAASLPAGLRTATFDGDGTLDGATAFALASADAHDTADFGYRGDGVIGDRIWFDLDGDGVQDAGEPGVVGQAVVLTWAGRDGVFDGTGDETWTVTAGADGAWQVTGLPDGEFRATVDGGIAAVADPTGDRDGTLDDTTLVTLSAADRDVDDADFGYRGANSVGDTVWWDEDEDGAVDAAEQLLAGVTLEVRWTGLDGAFGTADDLVQTTSTDAAGAYLVGGLPDGGQRVQVTGGIPAGLAIVHDPQGAVDGASELTLGGATSQDLDQDFGYAGSGALGDLVWLDLDGDGTRTAGEPGIPAVAVAVTWDGPDGTFGTGDDRVWTDSTDGTGAYRVDGLPAGAFRVAVSGLPTGLTPTADADGTATPAVSALTLNAGQEDLVQDFGFAGTASLGDTVWMDLDGDGVQSALEPGIPGLTVTLRLPGVDPLDPADDILVTDVTDGSGHYGFTGLPTGAITVSYDTADLVAGYVPSSDRDGGDAWTTALTLATGDAVDDVDFGIFGDATLHGIVFDDRNGNGVQDAGERGRAGIVLTIVWQSSTGPVLMTVTTDANGEWRLENLPAGTWVSSIDITSVPAGYRVDTASTLDRQLVVGGSAFVPMGITNLALAMTGTDPRMQFLLALLALLSGLGILVAVRARRIRAVRRA